MQIRPATPDDATDLVRLADIAGEGLPSALWAKAAEPGERALDVGRRRALRDHGAFSWRNAAVAEEGGAVAGLLVTYRIADRPEPLDGLPEAFRNPQSLENMALGSQYVNILAIYPEFRGRGLARALLAEAAARGAGADGLSVIVADRNGPACTLYLSEGYAEAARLPLVRPEGWICDSEEWVLLTKGRGVARPPESR